MRGCGEGSQPDPRAKPTKLSPEITVGQLQGLLANGDLTPGFGIRATPEVREAICKPATRGR